MYPISEFISLDSFVGLVRILFGLMFLVKLFFTIDAQDINWAHSRPSIGHSQWPFKVCLVVLVSSTICFTLGFFTGPAALIQFIVYVFLWRYASVYGLEDNVFQSMALYFVFAGAGTEFSLDKLFLIVDWGRYPAGTIVPELALTSVLTMIFFSAGVAKLKSPMWQKGLGVYYFFLMPLHRRWGTSLLTNNKLLMYVFNYVVLALQFVLLPAFFLNAVPSGILSWCFIFGFALLLSTLFVFTWLGEVLMLGFSISLYILLDTGSRGLGERWIGEVHSLNSLEQVFSGCLVFTLVAVLWTAIIPNLRIKLKGIVCFIDLLLRYVARNVWGFLPVNLFGERHIQGPLIYRTFAKFDGGESKELFQIFSERCQAGPERNWRPTLIEVTQYKVAEGCMELDQYGEIKTKERRTFILKLAQYITKKAIREFGEVPNSINFKTLQLIPPEHYVGADQWYLEIPWVEAFCVSIKDGQAESIQVLTKPILTAPTGRDLSRVSFLFNPKERN